MAHRKNADKFTPDFWRARAEEECPDDPQGQRAYLKRWCPEALEEQQAA